MFAFGVTVNSNSWEWLMLLEPDIHRTSAYCRQVTASQGNSKTWHHNWRKSTNTMTGTTTLWCQWSCCLCHFACKGWSLPYVQYLELQPGSQIVTA